MTITTGASNGPASPPAETVTAVEPLADRHRLLTATFAIAGGLGAGGALLGAFANPTLAPALLPLAALVAVAALCGALSARRERALLEARQRAEAASDAKSGFLAAASHEIRTPLNGILGLADLLLETNLSPEQQTYVRGVRSSGEALLHMVDEMLDFSRIEVGRFDLRPEPTDVTVLLQDIGELLAARAHAKAIDLAVDVDADLPASVLVDAARLRQVLVNLVDNAVKFTEAGGVVLSAACRPGATGGSKRIAFSVDDSGPGIDPCEAERIFGEFEQVERAPGRRHGGAGLGLAISRRIVRRMGSDIVLRARCGGGASFSFVLDLPVVEGRKGLSDGRLVETGVAILSPGGSEPEVLARGLAEAGASVEIARDIGGAARLVDPEAGTHRIDVLLVDQRIEPDPVVALTQARHAAGRRLPAVVLIEPGKRAALAALREAGFDAYLVRPVRRCSLVRIVADVVAAPGSFRADPEDGRPRLSRPRPVGKPLDVLLAEDNKINTLLIRSALESLGHSVTAVRDGVSAVDAVTQGDRAFAVILMDLRMPGLDGVAAARIIRNFEMRAGRPRASILALTADILPETTARALAAGVDAVLAKPISPEMLRQALTSLANQPAEPEPSAG
jgi:signal transduction histidine kinase/CheY-like chemotaxis protein